MDGQKNGVNFLKKSDLATADRQKNHSCGKKPSNGSKKLERGDKARAVSDSTLLSGVGV